MDDATIEILLKARKEGEDAIRDMKDSLADLRNQAVITNEQLSFIGAAAFTSSVALNALSDAAGGAQAGESATTGASGAMASTAASGNVLGAVLAGLTIAVITLAAAFAAPFIPVVLGATVILTAFATGVAAVSFTLFAALVPLGAVTAGVLMLADRLFTTGQIAEDPLARIEKHFSDMADVLGKQALPMAQKLIDWADTLIPKVEAAGRSILTWFGGMLPQVLQIAGATANQLFAAFNQAAPLIKGFIDAMVAQAPAFEKIFGQILQVGVQAVSGLANNLLQLSDWFMARLPAMAPIVQQIMGGIGSFIQGVGKVAGEVVDWFVKHWPEITNVATQSWDQIKAGWLLLRPFLANDATAVVQNFTAFMQDMHTHADALRGVMFALGVVFGILASAIMGAAILLMGIIDTIVQVISWIQALATWVHNITKDFDDWANKINAVLDALGRVGQHGAGLPVPGGGGGGGFGGNAPNFSFQSGGTVAGPVGAPVMGLLHGGERVTPVGGGGDMDVTNEVLAYIAQLMEQLVQNTGRNGFTTAAFNARA